MAWIKVTEVEEANENPSEMMSKMRVPRNSSEGLSSFDLEKVVPVENGLEEGSNDRSPFEPAEMPREGLDMES